MILRLNNPIVFNKNNTFSLPNPFSNKRLKVFFGRNLMQETIVVIGENHISVSGTPKTRKTG